jgi:tetratricopeptide (TPR) repeat protein
VANAVAYLHQQSGMAGLRDAIGRVAGGTDARQAVAEAAHGSWPEFERGWRAFMTAQRYHTFAAIDIPETHIRKESAIASKRKPTEDEALSSTLKLAPPYRFLRLGNILLRRNRPRAAVVEYEKGAKAVAGAKPAAGGDPAATWLFPVKLGRTYLALGEPDRALKALGQVQALYPELPWPNLIAGEALLAKGSYPEAVAALRSSLATNPFDPRVHCALAEAYGKAPSTAHAGTADVAREQKFCKELAEGPEGGE